MKKSIKSTPSPAPATPSAAPKTVAAAPKSVAAAPKTVADAPKLKSIVRAKTPAPASRMDAPAPTPVRAVAPAPAPISAPVLAKPAAPVPAPVAAKPAAAAPAAVASSATVITAQVDVGFGNVLYIRGQGPGLSWEKGVKMENLCSDKWKLSIAKAAQPVTFKFLINDETWNSGPDYVAKPGTDSSLTPFF